MNRRKIGASYEDEAARYLSAAGYRIVARNRYTPFGEIDLIAFRDGVYYFVEVKYRSQDHYGSPKEGVTRTKLASMRRCAVCYMKSRTSQLPYKISFLGIRGEGSSLRFDWIENVLEP